MVSNEQWAGTFDFECTGMDDHDYEDCRKCAGMRQRLVALLARRALEEAKWWKLQLESRIQGINFYQHMNFDVADKIELERIAALEQAAGKAAGDISK